MRTATLSLVALLVVACGGASASGPRTPANREARKEDNVAEQRKKVPGSYQCTAEVGDSTLGPGTCSVTPAGNAYQIEVNVDGHVLSGVGSITDAGFTFRGDYTCPEGESCKETVDGEFFEQDEGYKGSVATAGGIVYITFAKQ